MNITPLDISQKQFRRVLRGVDSEEVATFLSLVANELEVLIRENTALREANQRKEDELIEHRGRERALQETLVAAQRAAEDIRESSRKEAEITISDAELQAEKIVQSAHGRYLKIVDDIHELKRQRVQFEAGMKALVESHLKLLEAFKDAPREETISFAAGRKRLTEEG